MTKNYINSLIQKCLLSHKEELLKLWEARVGENDRRLLIRMKGNAPLALEAYYNEIVALTTETPIIPPALPAPQPLDAALREISVLLEGKEVFNGYLRDHVHSDIHHRLQVRMRLNDAFYTILRANSLSACDACRKTIDH